MSYGFDGSFQAKDLFLEEVERPGFASVAGEGGGAGRMDAVHPRVQFRLARRLSPKTSKSNQIKELISGAANEVAVGSNPTPIKAGPTSRLMAVDQSARARWAGLAPFHL